MPRPLTRTPIWRSTKGEAAAVRRTQRVLRSGRRCVCVMIKQILAHDLVMSYAVHEQK